MEKILQKLIGNFSHQLQFFFTGTNITYTHGMRSLVHNDHFCPLSSGITGTHGKRSLEHMDGEDTLGLGYQNIINGILVQGRRMCFNVFM